jgi:hypothetical protein
MNKFRKLVRRIIQNNQVHKINEWFSVKEQIGQFIDVYGLEEFTEYVCQLENKQVYKNLVENVERTMTFSLLKMDKDTKTQFLDRINVIKIKEREKEQARQKRAERHAELLEKIDYCWYMISSYCYDQPSSVKQNYYDSISKYQNEIEKIKQEEKNQYQYQDQKDGRETKV